ncbi:MAG: serine hydroxymethyltransferase, partial [Thermocrispum sp.]
DAVERLAVERAMRVFGADYADVQPHSGSSANGSVYAGLLNPGDTVLVLDPSWGGQRAHGSPLAISGRDYRAVCYGLNGLGRVDYGLLAEVAARCRPRLIVCSAGESPRTPDYHRFRVIADSVGAYLLADISQVADLVATGEQPSPVPYAHIVTCCTSTLGVPSGGLILMGPDAASQGPGGCGTLRRAVRTSAYPLWQGAPRSASIAAKAAALRRVATPGFAATARRSTANARALAMLLLSAGYDVLGHGTDNHTVWLNVASQGLTGVVAEQALDSCGLFVSRNRVPFDVKPPQVCSGIRLGTTVLTQRGMTPRDMSQCARIIDTALSAISPRSDTEHDLPEAVLTALRNSVAALCLQFPLPAFDSEPAAGMIPA